MNFKVFVRGVKRLIISVIKNDFYGMAAEMDRFLAAVQEIIAQWDK